MSVLIKGGPASGTNQSEWSITDDGAGMLSGTLRIFIDAQGSSGSGGGGGPTAGSGNLFNQYSGNSGPSGLFTQYSGNNGLSNPISSPNKGGSLHSKVPKKGDAHPYDGRLVCYGVSITYGKMGIAYADAQYVGLLNDPAGFEWDISCPTEEEPIELHPDFYALDKTVNGNTGQTESVGDRDIVFVPSFGTVKQSGSDPKTGCPFWDTDEVKIDWTSRKFEGFKPTERNRERRLIGVESYKVVRPTLRLSYSTMTTANWSWLLQQVGKKTSKIPYTEGLVDVPTMVGRDWLLTSVNVTRASGIYKVSTEYMMSGKYGWNEIIYQTLEDQSANGSSKSGSK